VDHPWSDICTGRIGMKSIREMTADTEVYRQEIRRLVETDPKAKQIYTEKKAELAAARQLREDDAWRLR
jgi:hypothetical protein